MPIETYTSFAGHRNICLTSGEFQPLPLDSPTGPDGVIYVASGVVVKPADGAAAPVVHGRFQKQDATAIVDPGVTQLQTAQAYFSNNSPFNQPYGKRVDDGLPAGSRYVDLSPAWEAHIGGNGSTSTSTIKALAANSDRRLHGVSQLDTKATFEFQQSDDYTPACDFNPGEPFLIEQNLEQFPFPLAGVSDDDGKGGIDLPQDHQNKDEGDETAIFFDGSKPQDWATSSAYSFWEVHGNGGPNSTTDEDTWSNAGFTHDGFPVAADPTVNACTGQQNATGPSHDGVGGTIRGSGLPLIGTVVRGVEAYSGINHPIGLELGGCANDTTFIYPATKTDGCGSASAIPYGLLLRLKPSLTPPAGMSRGQAAVWNAVKKYGLITVDQDSYKGALSFSRRGVNTADSGLTRNDLGYLIDAFGSTSVDPDNNPSTDPNWVRDATNRSSQLGALPITAANLEIVCTPDAVAKLTECSANAQLGQIVVVKDATPDDPQDFSFTAGGGLSPSSFDLDDDSDGTLSNTQTITSVPVGSGYSVAETVPAGWDQTSASCDDGSPVGNIDVGPDETVTCTFSNRKRGQIVVAKDAQPTDVQDFAFTAGGGLSPASFSLDDDADPALSDQRTFADVVPGSGYSVSETVPSGWDQQSATCDDGSPVSNVDVSAGETVTCTFTNIKRATLTALLDAQPDDPQDFAFTAGAGLSPALFSLDDDADGTLASSFTFADVAPGSGYTLAQAEPFDWVLTGATCDDGSPTFNIDLAPGEDVTCTFANKRRGQIVVVKDATPDDPQDFSFTAGGGLSPSSFDLDDDSDGTLSNTQTITSVPVGSGYSVAETVPAGWDQTSASCDDGSPVGNIDVGPDETVTCTFTNREVGGLELKKDLKPTTDTGRFDLRIDGQTERAGAGDGDATGEKTLAPGTHTLSESATTGTSLADYSSSIVCRDQNGTGSVVASATNAGPLNVSVPRGAHVVCTATNKRLGKIVVVKDAIPNNPQDFTFTTGGGLSPASFTLDDDTDPTLSNTQTFADVVPGSGYSVSETVPSGWDQQSATCDDGSPVSDVDVSAGETVTCTFTNSSGYPRPKGATPVLVSLTPAYAECTATNAVHGPPLASPSCNPPAQASGYLTVGTPDANGAAANFIGSVRYEYLSATSDVKLTVSIADVRNKSDLTDYSGEMLVDNALRITDKLNGPSATESGTLEDISFPVKVTCVPTVSTSTGSTCSTVTTANAITPGSVSATKRTIWQLGQVRVMDGGADGLASTPGDNSLFLRQGIFVP